MFDIVSLKELSRSKLIALTPFQCSQPSRGPAGPVGGLQRVLDRIGLLSVVRPGQSKCRAAVLGPGDGALQGEICVFGVEGERRGVAEDGREL